jgi:hypothetical protein
MMQFDLLPRFFGRHLNQWMSLLKMLPISQMEAGNRLVDNHRVAASPLIYSLQHNVVTPGSTTSLPLTEPIRDLLIRNAMLVHAVLPQGVKVAAGRTHHSHIVVKVCPFLEV